MMVVKKKRVANPSSSHRRTKPAKKRRLTAKQIKHFGTKRQKAALKASRTRKRAVNPAPRKRRATSKRKRNPAQLITLGFMNPHKPAKKRKKNSMATTKRRRRSTAKAAPRRRRRRAVAVNPTRRRRRTVRASNPRRRVARRRKNSTRIVVMAPRKRRSNPRRRRVSVRRRNGARRRNPVMFGRQVGITEMTKQVLGGLVGVTVTKMVPGMLPSAATSSPILATVTSIATAVAAGWAAGKVMPDIGSAVMFGGLMQAGSVLLNQFLPSVGNTIGLSGLGNLIGPASFTVPQNPLRPGTTVVALPAGAPGTGGARIGVSGLQRSFGHAF